MSSYNQVTFESFGSLAQYLIDNAGLTNRDFAEKINKHESQVSKWTNRSTNPQRKTIARFESFFDVTINKKEGTWRISEVPSAILREPNPDYYSRGDRFLSLINELPPLGSEAYSQDDALKLIELAEALLRSAKEALKHSSDDS